MIVLGIETSARAGSVAVCGDDGVLAERTFPEGARHARDVMPAVDAVLAEAGVARDGVDGVAVSEGPGSFTGLRVGVTCAKTLAYALGWRVAGVPSLEAVVQNVTPGGAPTACPVSDARRGKVYGTVFEWADGEWRSVTDVLILTPADLAAAVPQGTLVFGSGVAAYPEVFCPPRFEVGAVELAVGRAEAVALVGRRMLERGLDGDPMELVPRHYRPTGPEEKLQTANETGA